MQTFDLLLKDEAATAAFAGVLAPALAAEPLSEQLLVIHLSGDLGAGKTALARALLRSFGFDGAVKSPTFTLLETYNLTKFVIYHFDLYRFSFSDQWIDAGFDDVLAGPGLVLVEWPEKADAALPPPDLRLELAVLGDGEQRRLQAQAFSEAGRRCLSRACQANTSQPPASPDAGC
jgi:tRNA threonylcarbamoyladenosine biosynthesis protein TsaE